MPGNDLKLRRDPFGQVFRIHCDALKRDPELKRIGATIVVQDGTENDAPPAANYPWVRLSCVPLKSYWHDSDGAARTIAFPYRITVETLVDGTRFEDQSGLAFAILDALFSGPAIEERLEDAGMETREVEQMWFGVEPTGAPGNYKGPAPVTLYSRGWINVLTLVEV